jgi:hypothetical protein
LGIGNWELGIGNWELQASVANIRQGNNFIRGFKFVAELTDRTFEI